MAVAVARSNLGEARVQTSAADRDPLLVVLALLLAVALLARPSVATIAIAIWWNANTISHNFIHRPFFRSSGANFVFSCYLSALLGFPQTFWRDRHLAHHAGVRARVRISARSVAEATVVLGVWSALILWNPRFFAMVYLPGYLLGLVLCAAQGHYEHVRGVTSHYGRLYNFLCFNDGFHAEHHENPGIHWSELPGRIVSGSRVSRWPAMLRWLDELNLEGLERIVLRSWRLQAMVLRNHRRAFEALLRNLPPPARVIIVGGGLFPRTALLLSELLPEACITILDADPQNLEIARTQLLRDSEFDLRLICGRYVPGESLDCDLAVLPLSFEGDHKRIYRDPPARVALIHDWIWRSGRTNGRSEIVSIFLLKRLNMIIR